MPEKFGFIEKIINTASELPVFDKRSQKRAEWFIGEVGIEKYLKQGGEYLDVGTGKGHIIQRVLDDMENKETPLKNYFGIDVASKPLKKVQERELKRQEKSLLEKEGKKNPMNFSWAAAEDLPFHDKSLDGVSYIFSIHHMDKNKIDDSINEAMRVTKEDGYIFIAEDLVDSPEQREITEEIDRKLNFESKNTEHNYKSDQEWEEYFNSKGLEIVERKFFESSSNKGFVKHGFYVLKFKSIEK